MPQGYDKTVITLTELIAISVIWSSCNFICKGLLYEGLIALGGLIGLRGYAADVVVALVLLCIVYFSILLFKHITVGSYKPWQVDFGNGNPAHSRMSSIDALNQLIQDIETVSSRIEAGSFKVNDSVMGEDATYVVANRERVLRDVIAVRLAIGPDAARQDSRKDLEVVTRIASNFAAYRNVTEPSA